MFRKLVGAGVVVLGMVAVLPSTASAAPADGAGPWADSVTAKTQGKQTSGAPVLASRSNSSDALGVAEGSNTTGFYSLGIGGTITLKFTNNICNSSGADLRLVEATVEPYQPELVDVFASFSGKTFTKVATNVNKDADVSFPATVPIAKYIKLVDKTGTDGVPDLASSDGFDVDGVKGLSTTGCVPPAVSCTASGLRVTTVNLEPVRSNIPNAPCANDADSLLSVPPYATVVSTKTSKDPAPGVLARAFAQTAGVNLTSLAAVTADVVSSTAEVKCVGGVATLVGSSVITNLKVLGLPVVITGLPQQVSIPLVGTLFISYKSVSGGQLTQRALYFDFEGLLDGLGSITVAEAKVGLTGGPGNLC